MPLANRVLPIVREQIPYVEDFSDHQVRSIGILELLGAGLALPVFLDARRG